MIWLLLVELAAGVPAIVAVRRWKLKACRYGRHTLRPVSRPHAARTTPGRHRSERDGTRWLRVAEPIDRDLVFVGDTY
jgi:hypothetical protein